MQRLFGTVAAVAGCVVVFGSWAAEQTFYKLVQPDGSVVYGDAPTKGAVRTEKLKVPLDNLGSDADAAAAKRALEINREKLLQEVTSRDALRRKLDNQIAEAARRVKEAEAARESGRSIGVGDREGRHLSPQYWDRQSRLALALRQARTALDRLKAERDGLR